MRRGLAACVVLLTVPLLGCPTLTPSGGSVQGGDQIVIEVRFLTVEDTFFEEIGVDFDIPLGTGQAAAGGPTLSNPDLPQMPLAFGSDLLGGLNGGRYIYPAETSGGFLPGTAGVGGDANPTTLAYPGVLRGVTARSADALETDFAGFPQDPADLVLGTRNSDVADIFGRTLSPDQLTELLDEIGRNDDADVISAPQMTLKSGQRSIVQLAAEQSLASLAELTYLTTIQSLDNAPFSTWIGPVVDLTAATREDQVTLGLTWGTRAISVPIDGLTQIAGEGAQVFVPVLETGSVRTSVTIGDGQTLVLGGLRRTNSDDAERGLPLLADLPVLARPFRNQSAINEDRHLLILVRAQIVR